jgi:hypothetical protein
MRRILIILLAAIVLSPDPTGIPSGPMVQSCECEPVACHCSGHDHGSAHGPMCAFANGGRCGVKSADLATSDFSSRSDILVAEAIALPGLISRHEERIIPPALDRAGYERPPTPPPRSQA